MDIESHQELRRVNLVAINDVNVFHRGNPLTGLEEGGSIFLQTDQTTPEVIWEELPDSAKEEIQRNHFRLFGLDATAIARRVARTPDLINRMQGIVLLGVFLRVTPMAGQRNLDETALMQGVEKIVRKYFGKRGEKAVEDNMTCIRHGYEDVIEATRNIESRSMQNV
ncbi:MAG: 2-oxoacid:acceptor oxidoreductase family protein [Candidatus Zixiibacteriota bacterium]